MTRATAFLFEGTGAAVAFAGWIEGQTGEVPAWLEGMPLEVLPLRPAARGQTHVVGSMCHVMDAFTTGEVGLNMVTRNSYALNQAFVRTRPRPARADDLKGNMAATRSPRTATSSAAGTGRP